MKAFYWLLGALVVGFGLFLSIWLGDTQKTVPKITLSYFSNVTEISQAISKRLDQEINQNCCFWIGIEPEKTEHLDLALAIKKELENKNGKFDEVIVDAELKVAPEFLKEFQATQTVLLKESVDEVGAVLTTLENQKKKYIFLTAALYSNSFIKENQIHTLKKKYPIKPMTISSGFFATSADVENDATFRCSTDDKSGASNWGCALLNKARSVRRKINLKIQKPWIGVMDLTGEKDYMLMLRKQ